VFKTNEAKNVKVVRDSGNDGKRDRSSDEWAQEDSWEWGGEKYERTPNGQGAPSNWKIKKRRR